MRRYRAVPAVFFAILVSALVGGLFGRSALAVDDKIPDHYKAFTTALDTIENKYVGKNESDALVYGAIRELHGSVSAEHGIGTEKKDYLAWCRTPEEIALMRTLKQALDPHGLLNPGKVI